MLPIALGVAYMSACGYGVMAGVAAGTSLSSTSIGMATKVLQTLGELTSPLGNLVCVAAMVDDVLSLVILAVVSNVDGDDQGGGRDVAWMTSRPILASVGVGVLGAGLAVAIPRVAAMNRASAPGGKTPIANTIANKIAGTLFPTADDAVVWAMLALSLGVVVAAGAAGSTHLLGAFVGGAAFSGSPNARRAFARHAELNAWLTSVFFLSVGTRIPLRGMFDSSGVALGAGYSVVAVAGKLVTGAWCHPDWPKARAVGWAMVGRGELGFVMAQSARAGGLMGDAPYVASVWALLVATAASPVFMRRAIDVWKRLETVWKRRETSRTSRRFVDGTVGHAACLSRADLLHRNVGQRRVTSSNFSSPRAFAKPLAQRVKLTREGHVPVRLQRLQYPPRRPDRGELRLKLGFVRRDAEHRADARLGDGLGLLPVKFER